MFWALFKKLAILAVIVYFAVMVFLLVFAVNFLGTTLSNFQATIGNGHAPSSTPQGRPGDMLSNTLEL